MFCKYCGAELNDKLLDEKGVIYCSSCGKENKKAKKGKKDSKKASEVKEVKVSETKEDAKINEALKLANNPDVEAKVYQKDCGSVGWGILGFFIPIVGIILYFCLIKTSPRSANSAGAGALIAIVLAILAALVIVVLTLFTNIKLPAEFYY